MATKSLESEAQRADSQFDSSAFARHALAAWPNMAAIIDHTLLKPDATREQVLTLCAEAAKYRFACAMVNPVWASVACHALAGTGVPVGVVIGFPLGASLAGTKRQEAAALVGKGVRELDMVIGIGLLKSGMNNQVQQDIRGVVEVAHEAGAIVKVILETCLLTMEEKIRGSELAIAAGADFLKTSTGFSTGGATAADIAIMRGVAGNRCEVKASGGIRTLEDARALLEAGASRLGASAGIQIVREMGAE
jgi:deoxyribose-phosphate aldolase